MASSLACHECGAANRPGANSCRLCGAVIGALQGRRVREKILRRTDFLAAARANRRNTNRLIAGLLLLGAALGYLVGWNLELALQGWAAGGEPSGFSRWGGFGAAALLAAGALWTCIAFRLGDRIILSITGAREVSRDQEPQLHNVVEEMAIAAGLPKPRVFVLETSALNAFATGMSIRRSAIGVTRGLLQQLSRDELQGVIGHEMGHIVNLDMRYATAVGVMVGLVVLVADKAWELLRVQSGRSRGGARTGNVLLALILLVLFAALAPLVSKLVQMAVSRQREFLADATSVRLTRNPIGLISALEKLEQAATPFEGVNRATQHLFIVNPLKRFSERASALLATHPPIQARVQRLRNLGVG